MKRVQIFSSSRAGELQSQMNDFLDSLKDSIKIINIEYTSDDDAYSALIFYTDEKI